jgi:hypothetical protein
MDFTRDIVSMNNFKVDDECIHMGDRKCKVFSLVDVDNVGLPALVRPYHHMEVNNTSMPVDLLRFCILFPIFASITFWVNSLDLLYGDTQKEERKRAGRRFTNPQSAGLFPSFNRLFQKSFCV